MIPPRLPPAAGESVAGLCSGITVSATRLRGTIRHSAEPVHGPPGATPGGWQWMAQAAAVTSHLCELALGSLATRAGELPGLPGQSNPAWCRS